MTLNSKTIWIKPLVFISTIVFLSLACKEKDLGAPSLVSSFMLQNTKVISTIIDHKSSHITITVPYGTIVKSIAPQIILTSGQIIPKSGQEQDFSEPVFYTTIGEGGQKKIYQVTIAQEIQPQPEIDSFDKKELEAGESLIVKGKYFGNFTLDVKTYLTDSLLHSIPVKNILNDSNTLLVSLPFEIAPTHYQLKVVVKNKEAISKQKFDVRYPTPHLTEVINNHVLQGDTILLEGKYLDFSKYHFQFHLKNSTNEYFLETLGYRNNFLTAIADVKVIEGIYSVSIKNVSEGKESTTKTNVLNVYDKSKPFVTGIRNAKEAYTLGDKIVWEVLNFEKYPIRYYQVELSGEGKSYFQNALYDTSTHTLSIVLTDDMAKGIYQLSFLLADPDRNYSYGFLIDKKIRVL